MCSFQLLTLALSLGLGCALPALESFSPVNGSTAGAGATTVTLTFNETVTAGTGSFVFTPSSMTNSDQYVPIIYIPVSQVVTRLYIGSDISRLVVVGRDHSDWR